MFFTNWELWEQMTFVLGCAIMAVFVIGYVKLLWVNRYVRKQEIVDEEKRSRIQALRNSGQIIESQREHDIPFGVRAIQSGIQVDGIWISNSNTPAPSELRLDKLSTVSDRGHSGDPPPTMEEQNIARGRSPHRNDYPNSNPVFDDDPYHQADPGSNLLSYKPRKASRLQFNSYTKTKDDHETFAQLEGNPSPPKKKVYSHRPRGSRGTDLEDSSAADNEQSSGGSSDSDNTLSGNLHIPSNLQGRYSPIRNGSQEHTGYVTARVPSGYPTREPFSLNVAKSEYAQIPLGDSPNYEDPNPFLTSEAEIPTHPAQSLGGQFLGNAENYFDYQPVQRSGSHPPPNFVPGELHVNRQVRKVNSGFEVLPAGTFGVPAQAISSDSPSEDDSGDKRQTKLQKKPR